MVIHTVLRRTKPAWQKALKWLVRGQLVGVILTSEREIAGELHFSLNSH